MENDPLGLSSYFPAGETNFVSVPYGQWPGGRGGDAISYLENLGYGINPSYNRVALNTPLPAQPDQTITVGRNGQLYNTQSLPLNSSVDLSTSNIKEGTTVTIKPTANGLDLTTLAPAPIDSTNTISPAIPLGAAMVLSILKGGLL